MKQLLLPLLIWCALSGFSYCQNPDSPDNMKVGGSTGLQLPVGSHFNYLYNPGMGLDLKIRYATSEKFHLGALLGVYRMTDGLSRRAKFFPLLASFDYFPTGLTASSGVLKPFIGADIGPCIRGGTSGDDPNVALIMAPKAGFLLSLKSFDLLWELKAMTGVPADRSFLGINVGILK